MNAKAALCQALLEGLVINIRNIHKLTGLTNVGREIPRMIERPFGVEVSRTHKEGENRYGSNCTWTDYYLRTSKHNQLGIEKMKAYVAEQLSVKKIPCRPKDTKELVQINLEF